jgi:hypothetical protein
MPRSGKVTQTEKLTEAALRFEVRFRKTMAALDHLGRLKVLDAERLKHTRLILEHCRARIGLDVAEATQQCELQNCNRIDGGLRKLEQNNDARADSTKSSKNA